MKKALITGITGQDGSYLAEFLLSKGYEVHGIKRRSSSLNTERIDHIYQDPHEPDPRLFLHYGDMTDSLNIQSLVTKIKPDEIYNLAAQSHVAVSFEMPEYTANVDALGTLRILEAIRGAGLEKTCKFYQASTSELYGMVQENPQTEKTPFYPRSPYGVAKIYSYWITVNYRESYGMYACNGILFNHESPRRGETFVTRKITRAVANLFTGQEKCLYLGNINSLRDWGHAKDYIEMQWLMLQQDEPSDYVIATGNQISVREFVELSFSALGIKIGFKGSDLDEVGFVEEINTTEENSLKVGDIILKIDKKYYRPAEVETLLGSAKKAENKLGWKPKISVGELAKEMTLSDLRAAKKNKHLENMNKIDNE